MKIGDVLWVRRTDYEGSLYGEVIIVGETPRSWLIMSNAPKDAWALTSEWMRKTAPKMPKNLKGWAIGTKEEAEQKSWAIANIYKISQKVMILKDPLLISKIAALIGYMDEAYYMEA